MAVVGSGNVVVPAYPVLRFKGTGCAFYLRLASGSRCEVCLLGLTNALEDAFDIFQGNIQDFVDK